MASIGEVIYEDYLYKFTGRSRSIFWGKANPWREKYFILKRLGNKPVLEYFNKKPKIKTVTPKGKVELWPSFRVEKVTNMKNRAYVFQVTTPTTTLCLSADEQRSMDMFVFFLQIQCRLKEQIATEVYSVESENSEALRRIGARGTNCVIHVSPYGVTLALQSNKAVIAQWPLKSIRSYESSERGQFSIEAGRIAPMGDGLYIFNMEIGEDTMVYDVLDRFVMDNLTKLQPGNRGDKEELEDYVLEAERLLALTVVSACTTDNPDVRHIVNNNWNTDLINTPSTRPRQIVHTRLKAAGSVASLNSQKNLQSTQSAPARTGTNQGNPQMSRTQPSFQNSPAEFRRGSNQSQPSMADRPPLPPPSSSIPGQHPTSLRLQGLARSASEDNYLRMNSSSSTSSMPFSPSPSDNMIPPKYRDAYKQQTSSLISENGQYDPGSYLRPSWGGAPVTSTPNHRQPLSSRDEYLTPLSSTAEEVNNNGDISARPKVFQDSYADMSGGAGAHIAQTQVTPTHSRIRRLRSVSCDDVSDYLRSVVYDPKSKSMDDLLDEGESELGPDPFPRIRIDSEQEYHGDHGAENYYNIEGLKGKIYDAPGQPVNELIYKFSKRARRSNKLRRSVSNPNFIGLISKQKLHSARVHAGYTGKLNRNSNSSSISSLLPDTLKRHLNREHHKGSHSALSSGAASKNSSKASSRASSTRSSPANTLNSRSLQRDEVIASAGVKGINITRRSRSFKKQKPDEYVNLKNGNQLPQHSKGGNAKGGNNDSKLSDSDGSIDVLVNGAVELKRDTRTYVSVEQVAEKLAIGLTVLAPEDSPKPAKRVSPKPAKRVSPKPAPKAAPKTAPKPTSTSVHIEGSVTTSV